MKKFLVLYRASASGFAEMMSSTPEQKKAGMEGWMSWMKKAAPSIVDMGAPLGKSVHFDKTNAAGAPVSNGLGGYTVLQAASTEALSEVLVGHPHFMMSDATIEVIEIMPMPGM